MNKMEKRKFPCKFLSFPEGRKRMKGDWGGVGMWGMAMKMWAITHLEKVALRTVPSLKRGCKNDKQKLQIPLNQRNILQGCLDTIVRMAVNQ